MFSVTTPSANRVDIEVSGSLDSDEMQAGLEELIEKSADVTDGLMLYTITDFSMPTMGALSVEFTHLPKLFGLLGKFDRCAVVCDEAWIRTAAEVESVLIPGLEIKSFELKARKAAEHWLTHG